MHMRRNYMHAHITEACTSGAFIITVLKLAENAMDMLKRMRARAKAERSRGGKRKAKEEVNQLFNYTSASASERKKLQWKHKFLYLAYRDQTRIPTTDVEKDYLLQAGLGEKQISFYQMNLNAEQFRDVLFEHFQQLRHAGGFQLCKCLPNSRKLEVLSKFAHSSPECLQQRVGNARTYIRPLHKDLDLTAIFNLPDGVSMIVTNIFIKI